MRTSKYRISRASGFTLIELTLVIAVLLTLISVLFIGTASYKEGTNRAKCLLTISTVQKAVRAYQNLYELKAGDAIAYETLVGDDKLVAYVTPCGSQSLPPIAIGVRDGFAASGYNALDKIPEGGVPLISCKTTGLKHVPSAIGGW